MSTYRTCPDDHNVVLDKHQGMGFQFVSWRSASEVESLSKPLTRIAKMRFKGAVSDAKCFTLHKLLLRKVRDAGLEPKSEHDYRVFMMTTPGVFAFARDNEIAIEI